MRFLGMFREKVVNAIAVFMALLASSVLLSLAFAYQKNTLKNNGRWDTTKLLIAPGFMGAQNFHERTQALSGRRLNLGAWHGFQEVVYAKPVQPASVEFKFFCPDSAYFYFIFNKSETGFSGVRISTCPLYPTMFISALDNGKFLTKRPFNIDGFSPNDWNHFKIDFLQGGAALYLNGDFVKSFDSETIKDPMIGFRGCYREVLVDDVVARGKDGSILINETFSPSIRVFLIGFIFAISVLLGISLLILKPWLPFLPDRFSGAAYFSGGVFAVSLALFWFAAVKGNQYPSVNGFFSALRKQEIDWRENLELIVDRDLAEKYGNTSHRDSVRVLFIGTSQTSGVGAKREDEIVVNQVQRLLNGGRGDSPRYECINAAIDSVSSSALITHYERAWIDYGLKACVINLSTNDQVDIGAYRLNLQHFIDLNKARNIKTVFLLEGNSPEKDNRSLILAHEAMSEIGKKNNVPIFNAHEFLIENRDKGIVWWDFVHLTAFGQELLAEFIVKQIKPVIRG